MPELKRTDRLRAVCAALIAAALSLCAFTFADPEWAVPRSDRSGAGVRLRDFPYPYSAMAAIVNDCDNTMLRSFERYHRFLNTREQTVYGEGLGLDVSDSFFAYTAAGDYNAVMTYFMGLDPGSLKDARRIARYFSCGWIDTLHTYGDFSLAEAAAAADITADPVADAAGTAFSRGLASAAAVTLWGDGIFPAVWIDHGNEGNTQNFASYGPGAGSRYRSGDDAGSRASYHTDITVGGGVKYIWNARRSGRFGSDFPLAPRTLRDGRRVWAFDRYTGAGGGESAWDWYPDRLRYEITEERLSKIVKNREYGLFAQHLGFYGDDYAYEDEDVAALRMLAEWQHDRRELLVAGTARLLEYATARKFARYTVSESAAASPTAATSTTASPTAASSAAAPSVVVIDILGIDDPLFPDAAPTIERLRGLTFYCDAPSRARILIHGVPVGEDELAFNPPDETGRPSISIKWFAPDHTDYTQFG